jgi:hypothetical protein
MVVAEEKNVEVAQFGKDHWSLLAYVEDTCVNGKDGFGTLAKSRHAANKGPLGGWRESWGTRLHGFFAERKPDLQLGFHDDWDCLKDLEAAGFIEVISEANGFVKMTDAGNATCAALRTFKSQGGQFANFVLSM